MTRLVNPNPLPFHTHDADIVLDGDNLLVSCVRCGARFTIKVTDKEAKDVVAVYSNGGHHPDGPVQDIFPSWKPSIRELFLQTNCCDDCWNVIFPPEEEESDG